MASDYDFWCALFGMICYVLFSHLTHLMYFPFLFSYSPPSYNLEEYMFNLFLFLIPIPNLLVHESSTGRGANVHHLFFRRLESCQTFKT